MAKDDFIDGKLNETTYRWDLISSTQYIKMGDLVKGQQTSRYFGFYTTLCDAKTEIHTPAFETKSQLFDEILSKGQKQLGGSDNDFKLTVTIPIGHLKTYNGVGTYSSTGDQTGSFIEIVKTEVAFDAATQKQFKRVWFKFGATLYHEITNEPMPFKQGIMIARFF